MLAASPELVNLNRQLRDGWKTLRTLRAAFRKINKAVPGAEPARALAGWEAVENIDAGDRRDPIDEAFIAQWREAVVALHSDPETELPTS